MSARVLTSGDSRPIPAEQRRKMELSLRRCIRRFALLDPFPEGSPQTLQLGAGLRFDPGDLLLLRLRERPPLLGRPQHLVEPEQVRFREGFFQHLPFVVGLFSGRLSRGSRLSRTASNQISPK